MPPIVQLINIQKIYDIATAVHLSRLTSYDLSLAKALDDLIKGLKTDGIWSKIEMLCVQHYNSTDSLLDLKASQDSTALTGVTWSTDGWTMGSSTGECIDSQVSPSTSSLINQNDNHVMAYINTIPTDTGYLGACGNLVTTQLSLYYTVAATDALIYYGDQWAEVNSATLEQNNQSGFMLGSLLSGDSVARNNATEATDTDTSVTTGMPPETLYFGGYNGFALDLLSGTRFTAWASGGGLTSTERDNYQTHIQTYMTAMGWEA